MTSFVQRLTESCSNKQTKCKRTSSQTNQVKSNRYSNRVPQTNGSKAASPPPQGKAQTEGSGSPDCTRRSALPYFGVHRQAEVCPRLVPTAREARGTQVPVTARDSPAESQGQGAGPEPFLPSSSASRTTGQ